MVISRLFGKPKHPRESRFAGVFYPESSKRLRALIDSHLVNSHLEEAVGGARAVVVPHSDMNLVAPIAGAGFRSLRSAERAVVVAPSHKIPFRGIAVPNADGWTSPLGTLSIDVEAYEGLGETGHVRVVDPAFGAEPGVELQVPWLQRLGEPSLVPFLCGDADADVVAELLDAVLGDDDVLVVAAELARDRRDEEVRTTDEATLAAVLERDAGAIARDATTATTLLRALVKLAAVRGWQAEILDHRTSIELGADGPLAAGYAAIALHEGHDG